MGRKRLSLKAEFLDRCRIIFKTIRIASAFPNILKSLTNESLLLPFLRFAFFCPEGGVGKERITKMPYRSHVGREVVGLRRMEEFFVRFFFAEVKGRYTTRRPVWRRSFWTWKERREWSFSHRPPVRPIRAIISPSDSLAGRRIMWPRKPRRKDLKSSPARE